MAISHNTKKLRTYHSLFQINRAFSAIHNHCHIVGETGLMPVHKMRIFSGLIRELQSEISHDIVDKMHSIEDDDAYRFEKTRIARERYLNPERQ